MRVCVCVCDVLLHYRSINLGETPHVETAASMFHKICYGNHDGLVAGIICAGWDPVDGGQVSELCFSEGVSECVHVCCMLSC